MIALNILDVKGMMARLLMSDSFDSFLLSEAVITTSNTFTIDGHIHADYYTPEERENLQITSKSLRCWRDIRPFCLDIIKGKNTPLAFKFVLLCPFDKVPGLLEQEGIGLTADDINGLYLNLKFESGKLVCITGTSIRIFTMDKTLENSWDRFVRSFLDRADIAFDDSLS